MMRGLSVILLFACAVGTSAQVSKSGTGVMPASASSDAAPRPVNPNLAPSQIFSRARPSVVVIIASDQNDQREALGSGFIVDRRKIVTNHHVVEGMSQAYVVFSDGATKPVTRVAADSAQQDLIVLRLTPGIAPPSSLVTRCLCRKVIRCMRSALPRACS